MPNATFLEHRVNILFGLFIFIAAALITSKIARRLLSRSRANRRHLRVLHVIAMLATSSVDEPDFFSKLLSSVTDGLGWDVAIFWQVDTDGDALRFSEGWARLAKDQNFLRAHRGAAFLPGEPGPGVAWREGKPRLERYGRSYRARLSIPIGSRLAPRSARGVLELYRRRPVRPDPAVNRMIERLSAQIERLLERRLSTLELRQALHDQRMLLDSIPAAVWFTDENDVILRCNQMAAKGLGRQVSDVEGRTTSEFFPAEAESSRALDRDVIHSGHPKLGAVISRRNPEGELAWFRVDRLPYYDQSRRVRGVIFFSVEITDRVRAEKAQRFLLQASETLSSNLDCDATLKRTAQLATEFMADLCIIDVLRDPASPAQSEVERVTVAAVTPSLAEESHRLSSAVVKTGDDRNPIAQVIATGQPAIWSQAPAVGSPSELCAGIRSMLIVPMRSRGRTLGALTLVTLNRASGRIYGPEDLGLALELAHRSALALDNARLFREAQAATRARQELLASVSHELKNPLAAVELNAGLLERMTSAHAFDSLPEPAPRMLDQASRLIQCSASTMKRLIADLLDQTKMESGSFSVRPGAADLRGLLREVAEMAALFCREKGQAFTLRHPDTCGSLVCDRERMLQVAVNLIRNAVKFTPIGGRIELAAVARDDEVEFTVADSGPGIPEHEVGRIFERFWQGRSARHLGTGLGLWITKGIVEAHAGKIRVESEVGVGTRFIVVIPRHPPHSNGLYLESELSTGAPTCQAG